jgi:hypothetical protein
MKRILFTNSLRRWILLSYEAAFAMFILFLICSYFSKPTSFIRTIGKSEGTIIGVSLKRQSITQSIKSFQKGYYDFYEVEMLKKDVLYRCSGRKNVEELEEYGIENLKGKKVEIQYNQLEEYRAIRELKIDDKIIVHKEDIGLFPFLLFVGLTILFLNWGLWGFYITYLISDEKRNEILKD